VISRRGLLSTVLCLSLTVLAGCAVFGTSHHAAKRAGSQPLPMGCEWKADPYAPIHTGVPPAGAPASGVALMTVKTGYGPIEVRMDRSRTPCTVASFAYLGSTGYFTDTICHRLTTKGIFVLQCGDPTGKGTGAPSYIFADEALPPLAPAVPTPNLTAATCNQPSACLPTRPKPTAPCLITLTTNKCVVHQGDQVIYPRGTVALANSGPDTNGSQFFIVWKDSLLDPQYTPFGQVVVGMDIVDMIAKTGAYGDTGDGGPRQPVTVLSITVR
jgi:peptidyl-prolyl cis-trans isomerase B (cyclophilin B)